MRLDRLLSPGDLLQDRYRIGAKLGAGGMAVVYEANDTHDGDRPVAVKWLRGADGSELRNRFAAEARACMRLTSRYAVAFLDEGAVDGIPFLVFERLFGCDLAAELAARRATLPTIVDWALDACDALGEAHARGIVHRDVKPENLFVCDDVERRYVKVLDFGISKLLSDGGQTSRGSILGTTRYLSPEQVRGEPVTPASDLFALGVVIYHALEGRLPFVGTTPAEYIHSIGHDAPPPLACNTAPAVTVRALDAVMQRLLAKPQAARFESAGALTRALEPFASGARDGFRDGRPTGAHFIVVTPASEDRPHVSDDAPSDTPGSPPTKRW